MKSNTLSELYQKSGLKSSECLDKTTVTFGHDKHWDVYTVTILFNGKAVHSFRVPPSALINKYVASFILATCNLDDEALSTILKEFKEL
jgi:hypothetical protein